jgi:hypothetical protein
MDASPTSPLRQTARSSLRHVGVAGAFEAFGATLLPILTTAGIELNEPMVARVHNEIKS